MAATKYSLENLRKHTGIILAQSEGLDGHHSTFMAQAFAEFSDFIADVESQPLALLRNVRLMLACKLLNHVYSSLILGERGLMVDAISCERNALETIAFHWLITLDSSAVIEYEKDEIPRPVEVRRRLERANVDVSSFRDIYATGSEISHVGRKSERFHSRWSSLSEGKLLFGGASAQSEQVQMFCFLPALLYLFCQQPMMKT